MDEEKQVWWWLVGDGDKGHEGHWAQLAGPLQTHPSQSPGMGRPGRAIMFGGATLRSGGRR